LGGEFADRFYAIAKTYFDGIPKDSSFLGILELAQDINDTGSKEEGVRRNEERTKKMRDKAFGRDKPRKK
jgi:hypothetical protein